MSPIENLYEAEGAELVLGVRMKPLFGDGAMLNLLEFDDVFQPVREDYRWRLAGP